MKQLSTRTAALLVAAVAGLVYVNALWNGFALDDTAIIQANARVHDWLALADIWLTPYWPTFGEELGLYRPLSIFAYALQWAAGNGAPWPFHATNLVLHAIASVLVFKLVLALLPTLSGPDQTNGDGTKGTEGTAALLAGLVFALHPVHTEAVANIVGQAELIAGVATLAACHLYVTRTGPRIGAGRLAGIAAFFVLGMLAKESAIVLPALLVALDGAQGRWRFERRKAAEYVRTAFMPMALLALVAVAYLGLRVEVLGNIGGVHAAPNLPFLREDFRVLVAFRAWPEYVRLLVWPADLSADYSPGVILPVEGLTPMAGLGAVLLAATCALALLTTAFPRAGLPAAWFIISILPVSNLLLPIGVVVAERLLYTPSIALSFIVAFAWPRAVNLRARTRQLVTAGIAVVLLAAGARVVQRNPDWKDTDAVWDALVRDHPESYRSQLVNAARAVERQQMVLAKEYTELAYRIWPHDAPMLHLLAQFAQQDAEFDRAIDLLAHAERVAPFAYTYPLAGAVALLAGERPHDAVAALDRAQALDAPLKFVEVIRAQAYDRTGRYDDAVRSWHAALDAPGPDLWTFWALLARSAAHTGDLAHALAATDSALALTSSDADRAYVGDLRAAIGRGCYAVDPSRDSTATPNATTSCDPLAPWGLVVPMAVPNATTLQNANAQRVDAATAARGG